MIMLLQLLGFLKMYSLKLFTIQTFRYMYQSVLPWSPQPQG
jgi:hypothetical protein